MARKRQPAKRPVDTQKAAAKKIRREERQLAEAKARERVARKRRLKTASAVLVGLVVVGTIGVTIVRELVPAELPGVEKHSGKGREHVAQGETVVYGTPTPTSGTHSAGSGRCGVFSQQVPLELAVHALEHGSVVIWYQTGSEDVATGLREIVNRFDDRVILSPNAELADQPIVATAWNRLKAYDSVDPEIADFIETYRFRGPESVLCPY